MDWTPGYPHVFTPSTSSAIIAEGQPCWTPTARFTEPGRKKKQHWNGTYLMAKNYFWVTIHGFFGWQYMAPILKRQPFWVLQINPYNHSNPSTAINKTLSLWCADSMLARDPVRYCKAFQSFRCFRLIAIHCTYFSLCSEQGLQWTWWQLPLNSCYVGSADDWVKTPSTPLFPTPH